MGVDEIPIDCVHKIWWGPFAGRRRDSGYFWHDAALPGGEVMRENKERKVTTCPGGATRVVRLVLLLLGLGFTFIIVTSCHANPGPPRLACNLPANSVFLLRKGIDIKRIKLARVKR